jgi:hypothetical protein
MPGTTADLNTTVVNISGSTMTFSYLGRHGKELDNLESYTVIGPIQNSFGFGEQAIRKRRAFERDLTATPPRITVTSTPKAVVADAAQVAAVANPTTQATVAPTGGGASGGLLPAGTYFVSYTWVNRWGETTVGTSESAQVTVGATNIPRVTIPALPANTDSANIYVTNTNGATTTTKLYKTGVTTTTTDLALATYNGTTYALTADKPAANTTKGAINPVVSISAQTLSARAPSFGSYQP